MAPSLRNDGRGGQAGALTRSPRDGRFPPRSSPEATLRPMHLKLWEQS